MTEKQQIRCAIYTRKSTEEGLEQEFNTLDAQRESGEAYIASMKHEGWLCLPDRYDDGGYTGGNMDRPGLKRLMTDIEAGKVDCIVVYKVDRLSRSLLDFSKIMEKLESHNVSFVSVTQQFNTSNSMGRLMLNVLLSFAQFEREIISERTRDKIAATRRKGKWSGGTPVLGYDVAPGGRKLLVNEDEAARVRKIFELYIEHQSLIETIKQLDKLGWTTKRWITGRELPRGGKPFTKNRLFRLLTNVIFLGKITLRNEAYDGEHAAIVDVEIFKRVQALLHRNGQTGGVRVRNKYGALLKGLLRCAPCGCSMSHVYTNKKGRLYRYYVCLKAQQRGWHTCPSKTLPAQEIERFVVEQIRSIGKDSAFASRTVRHARILAEKRIKDLELEKVSLEKDLVKYSRTVRTLSKDAPNKRTDTLDRIQTAERRMTAIREELIALGRCLIDERSMMQNLTLFDPVWNSLTMKEQARILQLLVERVDYNGTDNTVSVTFHEAGINELTQLVRQKKEVA